MKKIILYFVLALSSCKAIGNSQDIIRLNETKTYKTSLVAVGDNLIHHSIYKSGENNGGYDFKPIYDKMKPYIKKHDLAFVNQETILGGTEIGLSTYPRFNSPYEIGDALVDAGFNLISLANNHTLDRGEQAINNSLAYWQKQPVVYSGSELSDCSNIKVFTKNNIKFAFVAYTYGTNGIPIPENKDYLVNLFTYEKAKRDIEKVRNNVDVIIVSMHWGDEYYETPSDEQLEQANYLAELGVDIILGHHPHVIQPIDIIENNGHKTFVAYSLGNFLSDQLGIDRLIGMAFSLDIVKTVENEHASISLQNPRAKLFYTYKNQDNKFKNIFFNELNNDILNNYKDLFFGKKELIQAYRKDIAVS